MLEQTNFAFAVQEFEGKVVSVYAQSGKVCNDKQHERNRSTWAPRFRRAKYRGQLLSARVAECAADIRPAGLFRAEPGHSNGQRTFSRAGTQRIHRGAKRLRGPAGILP